MSSDVQAVRLTNRRQNVKMYLPDGLGNKIELDPGETRIVFGDYEYFRRMPVQGINGLTVKMEPNMRVPDADRARKADVKLMKITNHREVLVHLATGVDRGSIDIPPHGEVEAVVRESVVKQMTGLSFKELTGPGPEAEVAVVKAKRRGRKPKESRVVEEMVSVGAVKEEDSLSNAEEVRSVGAAGKIADFRKQLGLPDSAKEWRLRSRNISWHDLRGIAKQVGVIAKSRQVCVDGISKTMYPEQ